LYRNFIVDLNTVCKKMYYNISDQSIIFYKK
jgi:hypothetical protein